jgi:hypothetical protein
MNASSSSRAVMLPGDNERRQVFYWLQQVSSYTAWRRVFGYYQAWADATEQSVRMASDQGLLDSRIPEADYVQILQGLAHCEEGIRRLGAGDKRVFKFDPNGEFAMAARLPDYWSQLLARIELGEHPPIDAATTPGWLNFKYTLTQLTEAWAECSLAILEPRDIDAPSRLPYGVWLQTHLPTFTFPANLRQVPDPAEIILVATGQALPCSGIWEPVDAPKPNGMSLLRHVPVPKGPFAVVGGMNYLHDGSNAPRASLETADDNPEIDTVWRLLWCDDRYLDGRIPAEENAYVFRKPEAHRHSTPVTETIDGTIWAESGQAVSRAGRWLLEDDLHVAVTLQEGDVLPLHHGQGKRWVLADR